MLSALILVLLPLAVDVGLILPALPHLPATHRQAALLAAAYPLTMALALPVTSRTTSVRRQLLAGLAVAAAATVLEAGAHGAASLLVGRVVLGVGAAFALPAALRTVQAAFDPAEHVRAVAIWAGFTGLAIALAPWLGGGLVDGHGWAAVFAIQVPFLVVGLLVLCAILPGLQAVSASPAIRSGDLGGPAAVLALTATAAALSFRLQPDWSATSVGLLLLVPVTAFSITARFGRSRLGPVVVALSVVGIALTGDVGLVLLVLLVPLGAGAALAVSAAPGSPLVRLLAVALGLAAAALPPRTALLTAAAVSALALGADLLRRGRSGSGHLAPP